MRFLVIGGGGHAKVVIEAIRAMNGEVVGVIDASPGVREVLGVPVVGDDDALPSLRAKGLTCVALGLGANALRERIGRRVKELGFLLPPILHPSALVSPSAKIGEGVVVMARAVVGVETVLRDMSLVNTGAVLDHDNDLGVAAHVAPGCALAGNVRVGDRSLIGVGSAVRPGVRIGVDVVVGAGSAVVADIDDGACVGGAPARPIRLGRHEMRIGIVSTAVPLINGGGRFIVDWLNIKLREYGHQVETIYLPFTEEEDHILPQMAAFRMIELEGHFDRIIAIRPPAHVVRHPRKVVWFIHHLRVFYDLWGTTYCPYADTAANRALRAAIIDADNVALGEAYKLFTNSGVVGDRLRKFNDIESQPLFPPILKPEMFRSGDYGDEIVSVCRVEHHKRQHLLVAAMAHTKTPVRLRLCGSSANLAYLDELRESAATLGVADRVTFDFRWISEEEKADFLSTALASAYLPFDEDSYG